MANSVSFRTCTLLVVLAGALLTACAAPTPEAAQRPTAAQPTEDHAAHATNTPAATATLAATATGTSAPAATAAASPTATPRSGEVPAGALTCDSGEEPRVLTRQGLTVAVCFDPHPPAPGAAGTFTALVSDEAGQTVSDASLSLAIIGGMEGMLGDHDEDFLITLESQGQGRYFAAGTAGPTGLLLNGVSVRVRHAGQQWAATITNEQLGVEH